MKINVEVLSKRFESQLQNDYQRTPQTATVNELHNALSKVLMGLIAEQWMRSKEKLHSVKRACYLSAEFLVGRAIYNNLLCLDLYDEVKTMLQRKGIDINQFEEIEDAALGNGGLGRLAACFLDSAATQNLPLEGYGIRYKYGLFQQRIVDGFQVEEADDWTRYGDPWALRRDDDTVTVSFSDQTVYAVPYDIPVVGYGTDYVGTLRLWQAEPISPFDYSLFNQQKYDEAVLAKNRAEDICRILYPNDDTESGKILRLKQEYFLCSAAISDILRSFKRHHGVDFNEFSEYYAIQLNDTHPVLAIPELIRNLVDNEGMGFSKAFEIAQKTFHYTNHTIMAEAQERWHTALVAKVIPRIYEIILQINDQQGHDIQALGIDGAKAEALRIISGDMVHMARTAIYSSSHINGVAKIHTDILQKRELREWYRLYPDRFQNKTNGITPRRWLMLCNQELFSLITELLGNTEWITHLDELIKLVPYGEDKTILQQFSQIKRQKKEQLADYILRHDGVYVDPASIFDIQIKRLHEYKRQLLNAFSILYIYFGIKDGGIRDFHPTTFIFGAKAAPGYARAKGIIKYINEVARLVNEDTETNNLINVVYVQNYNVSYAEKLMPAADISEQISTAGTEASGTGNMKFMLNGAVTLGTYDGANVEIVEQAGTANNYIFGANVDELERLGDTYNPKRIYESDPMIHRVVDTLVDGTFDDNGMGIFEELYHALLEGASWHRPDHYYVLGDLSSYVAARLRANRDYQGRGFTQKCWLNVCHAGYFSADRTVREYAKEIWGIKPVL